jgi:hypothetical protein
LHGLDVFENSGDLVLVQARHQVDQEAVASPAVHGAVHGPFRCWTW